MEWNISVSDLVCISEPSERVMTLRTEYGWGYDRIMDLTEKWRQVRVEHKEAIEPHHSMADVKQEYMQRVFRDICANKKIEPLTFEERYPYLTKIRYDKKYKR